MHSSGNLLASHHQNVLHVLHLRKLVRAYVAFSARKTSGSATGIGVMHTITVKIASLERGTLVFVAICEFL